MGMSADEEAEAMAAIRRVGRLGFAAGALVSGVSEIRVTSLPLTDGGVV
jgi:hypothetical protein